MEPVRWASFREGIPTRPSRTRVGNREAELLFFTCFTRATNRERQSQVFDKPEICMVASL